MPRSRYADEDEEETTRPRRASSRYPEDDEDERPARKVSRYADDDDDEEEKPRRKRAAARDDDDEDEEEKPRRRRVTARDDDDEEDERPRRRAAARDDDDDEEEEERPRRRRASARDEEEERPRRSSRSSAPKGEKKVLRRGWGAANRVKESDSAFASRLKLSEDSVIVKFLEDEPYVSYRSHWIDGRKGQKSFTCIADTSPKGCPLCDAGLRASSRFGFNVVALQPDDEPVLKSYEVGSRVVDQLKNFNEDPRQGPLSKHYWAISRTGKGGSTATSHQMVKERDLDEWEIEGLDDDELDDFRSRGYEPDIVTLPTRKELMAIVDEDLDD